jgi:hypothetical protein
VSDRDDLERALRLLAAEQHPDAATLGAYHDGELEAERAAEVRGHLEGCVACRDRLADLAAFLDEPPSPPGPETAAAWNRLQERLEEERWADGTPFRRPGFFARLLPVRQGVLVLAAAVVAVAVGLVVWSGLREPVRTTVTLELIGGTRGGSEGTALRLLPDTGEIDLRLRLEPGTSFQSYRVEVRDERNELVHEVGGLAPKEGELSLTVPRRQLKVGAEYWVEVFGAREGGGEEEEAGEAAFRLRE